MASEDSPSVDGHELWRISNADAVALVDEQLGSPEAWSASALLEYRLSADFQADWKAEVGHWLSTAKRFGFLERMLRPVFGERDRKTRSETRDPHDPRHLKLHQHLASAMVCHYFTGLNWSFSGWETETGGQIDIDLALEAPDGTFVEFQVKAPDRPGILVNGQYRDGNFDHRVVGALDHAVRRIVADHVSPGSASFRPQHSQGRPARTTQRPNSRAAFLTRSPGWSRSCNARTVPSG